MESLHGLLVITTTENSVWIMIIVAVKNLPKCCLNLRPSRLSPRCIVSILVLLSQLFIRNKRIKLM